MSLASSPDHVAIAVPSIDAAAERWHGVFGGAWCAPKHDAGVGFATQQLWYRGGAKLELLEPTDPDGFAASFLERFGARVHHVTLQVPDLLGAVAEVRDAGYDVVDVNTEHDEWHEAFLRPSQVGGVIVQLARSTLSMQEWARRFGMEPEPQPTQGPVLHGPTFVHPDLDAAQRIWTTLGAHVEGDDHVLQVRWPNAPLDVEIHRGELGPDPVLRFGDAEPVGTDPRSGPATTGPTG